MQPRRTFAHKLTLVLETVPEHCMVGILASCMRSHSDLRQTFWLTAHDLIAVSSMHATLLSCQHSQQSKAQLHISSMKPARASRRTAAEFLAL
jgi:hypothetical protein